MSGHENSESKKRFFLYVLKLENDKYYVGLTAQPNPNKRIAQHKAGFAGAAWTKRYKPVETLETQDLGHVTRKEAERVEKQTTLAYMKKYGYNNVRGAGMTYPDKYVRRFGVFFPATDWRTIMTIVLLLLIMGILYFL